MSNDFAKPAKVWKVSIRRGSDVAVGWTRAREQAAKVAKRLRAQYGFPRNGYEVTRVIVDRRSKGLVDWLNRNYTTERVDAEE